ncbi:MAG TPA: hypothetical protein ENN74_02005, partial [Firmicutes bacterium]|nr:hypothetical protein [Bacillota bacterium]
MQRAGHREYGGDYGGSGPGPQGVGLSGAECGSRGKTAGDMRGEATMKILVLNSGSSSVKYQLLEMEPEQLIAKGLVQRIGSEKSSLTHQVVGKPDKSIQKHILDHTQAIHTMMDVLTDPQEGVVK